jgi:hypothetical protein
VCLNQAPCPINRRRARIADRDPGPCGRTQSRRHEGLYELFEEVIAEPTSEGQIRFLVELARVSQSNVKPEPHSEPR